MHLTVDTFEEFLTSNGPSGLVMIDFYTDLCGPCRLMEPHYLKMAAAFPKIKFAKFDCNKAGHEAFAKRNRVRAMPTFSLFCGGQFVESMSGHGPLQLRQLLMHYNR
ncbi:hypothetical protein FOA52_013831 [Chlamydomonas sp. UWO 241]|nr:hypothetical protein FOA52_013831 [Chlamydomonas sp. UWO 241]